MVVGSTVEGGPRIGSLFSGYGGLDMAVRRVFGGDLAWWSDIEPGPVKIMSHHYPDRENLGDITKIDFNTVAPVDILTGGTPCQDLSVVGRRAGLRDGTRSGLWAGMALAVEILQPELVVWENVQGALHASAKSSVERCGFCMDGDDEVTLRALGRVLGDLTEIGYDAIWTTVRASTVGAAHHRERVFVLAYRPGGYLPTPYASDPDSGSMSTAKAKAEGRTIRTVYYLLELFSV